MLFFFYIGSDNANVLSELIGPGIIGPIRANHSLLYYIVYIINVFMLFLI